MRFTTPLLLWVVMISCQRDLPPRPGFSSGSDFELLWKSQLCDNRYSNTMDPILFDDVVICACEYEAYDLESPFLFFDTVDGSLKYGWSDYVTAPDNYYSQKSLKEGDYLVFGSQLSIYSVHIPTGQTAWQSNMQDGSPFLGSNNGYVYRGIQFNWQSGLNSSGKVIRADVATGQWETVFSLTETNGYAPNFDSFGFGELPNGDEVVLWKNRTYHDSRPDITGIFAYNLTADSLMWRNSEFTDYSSTQPVQVEGDRAYAILATHMIALDLMTGQTVWYQDFSGLELTIQPDFGQGNFYISNNKIVLKGASDELIYLHKSSGNIAKLIDGLPYGIEEDFTFFEDKLFFGTNRLTVVDARLGTQLVSDADVRNIGNPNGRIVIDEHRRVLYFQDGYYLYCVKIPDNI